jgi:transposase
MTKGSELAPHVMGAGTSLNAYQTDRQIGQAGLQLPARDLPAQQDPTALIHADQVEGVLAQVDADGRNGLSCDLLCHDMAPWLRDNPVLPCSTREHGRSMPLDFPARLEEIAKDKADGCPVEIWFADEARIGQKNKITRRWARRGTRPSAPRDLRTASAYIFGAICPAQGKGAGLVLPRCTTEAMALHLAEISQAVAQGSHAVLMLDQAGWHVSRKLKVPANITLAPLPAKAPELNPVENIWQYIRENWISNRVFTSYTDILDHCCAAWNKLTDQPWTIMSIGLRVWAHQ